MHILCIYVPCTMYYPSLLVTHLSSLVSRCRLSRGMDHNHYREPIYLNDIPYIFIIVLFVVSLYIFILAIMYYPSFIQSLKQTRCILPQYPIIPIVDISQIVDSPIQITTIKAVILLKSAICRQPWWGHQYYIRDYISFPTLYLEIRACCYHSGPAASTQLHLFLWRPAGSGKRSFPWKAPLSFGRKFLGSVASL
jgi:hypothetical protein